MNAQTHHVAQPLRFGRRSEVHWALVPKGKALLFVHGFGGSATKTWVQFPSLLQAEPSCSGHDHIFFGYDSLRRRARPSADELITFLDALFHDPIGLVNETLGRTVRKRPFRYTHVTLVAHSLGALVSRLALLDAFNKRRAWTSKTSLVLFAPAHEGANILALASLAMGAFRLVPVEALARYKFQVLHDLDESSPTLKRLRTQTKAAIAKGGKHLIARRVVYAGGDTVVNPYDFCQDPSAEFIQNASHTSVCKPSQSFVEPLVHLLNSI